jgi:RNA polymerase sigma-70 factor (ECF subfamily)
METSRVLDTPRARVGEGAGKQAGGLNLAAVYDAHAQPLYRYLLTLLSGPEEAEDALQEIFLGVLRRAGQAPIRELRTYLFQAARNQAFLVLRKRRRQDKESAAAALSWIDPEQCPPGQRETAIDVDRALRQLPLEQREIVVLKLSEGFTFKEIADLLGIPRGTAASRYRLALARLRRLLEGGDDDD